MSKFLSLLLGAAILCGGCRSGSDQSGRAGDPTAQPTPEDCTHFACFWLLTPDHPAWAALDNRYWPCLYLLDRSGKVVDRHIGELHEGTDAWNDWIGRIDSLRAVHG